MVENLSISETITFGANNTSMIDITVTGAGTYTYDWSTDESGDFDDNEDLNNLPNGSYSVVVHNEFGCSASKIFTISEPNEIDLIENTKISIFPNPTNDVLNIEYPNSWDYSIVSIKGQFISKGFAKESVSITIKMLPKGIYILNIKTKNKNLKTLFLKE